MTQTIYSSKVVQAVGDIIRRERIANRRRWDAELRLNAVTYRRELGPYAGEPPTEDDPTRMVWANVALATDDTLPDDFVVLVLKEPRG